MGLKIGMHLKPYSKNTSKNNGKCTKNRLKIEPSTNKTLKIEPIRLKIEHANTLYITRILD